MSTTTIIREALATDIDGISHVRISVRENALTRAQLDARGITNEAVLASFERDSKGWVADAGGEIVAFSIADRASRSIFALFVLPQAEQHGYGTALLQCAVDWLFQQGKDPIWLTTGPETTAAVFYARRGWTLTRVEADGQLRFELRDPA